MARLETLTLPVEPEAAELQPLDIWYDYRPEKPRLLLALDQESTASLTPLYNQLAPYLSRSLVRLYDTVPGIGLATFTHPQNLYPDRTSEEKMEVLCAISRDFHQAFGRQSLEFNVEDVLKTKIDRQTQVIGLKLDNNPNVLDPLREQLLWMTSRLLRDFGRVYQPGEDWLDRVHNPQTILPLARPYRHSDPRKTDDLVESIRKSAPSQISFQPALCLPEVILDSRERPPFSGDGYDYVPLSQRALRAAQQRPESTVEYSGPLTPIEKRRASRLGNLVVRVDDSQSLLVIRSNGREN